MPDRKEYLRKWREAHKEALRKYGREYARKRYEPHPKRLSDDPKKVAWREYMRAYRARKKAE